MDVPSRFGLLLLAADALWSGAIKYGMAFGILHDMQELGPHGQHGTVKGSG